MKLLFFCPRWGNELVPWEVFLPQVKNVGYDGVEIGLPKLVEEWELVLRLLKECDLKYILQHYETNAGNYEAHKCAFNSRLEQLLKYKPYLINSHTGRDFFTAKQNLSLLAQARKAEQQFGVPILHETHRSRFSYAAHTTQRYLKYGWVKLTLDISHWFCVASSLLFDQADAVNLAIAHTHHIHARIGHEEGPQVYNFRDPKWQKVVDRHLELWDRVIAIRLKLGKTEIGITTEFGPWPYMPVLPTRMSSQAYLFDKNIAMMSLLKQRYQHISLSDPMGIRGDSLYGL